MKAEERKVRLSFDVPITEHTEYKRESVDSHMPLKVLIYDLLSIGWQEYRRRKFLERLDASIQQAKEGKTIDMTEEIDRSLKEIEEEEKWNLK